MRHTIVLSAALAAFGGSGASNGRTTGEDAARPPAEYIAPGRWQGVVTNDDVEFGGALSEVERLALSQIAKPRRFEECITPAQARRPSVFFGEPRRGCRIMRSTVANGAIDRVMVCDFGGGRELTITATGTYAADHYRMTDVMAVAPTFDIPSQRMKSVSTITAKRIGPCTGSEGGRRLSAPVDRRHATSRAPRWRQSR
jgi:hypothetical protein